MDELKYLTRKLKIAIAKADEAEEKLEAVDYLDDAAADEFEKFYDETIKIREEIAAKIVKATAGQIDEKTAYKMTYNPKFWDIITQIA